MGRLESSFFLHPSKKSCPILDAQRPHGDSFKLLGVKFGTKLCMKDGVMELAAVGYSRVQMVSRTRHFDFMAHALSFLEHATPALHHTIPFHVAALGRVQESLWEALRLTPCDALTKYKLAPLRTRRAARSGQRVWPCCLEGVVACCAV